MVSPSSVDGSGAGDGSEVTGEVSEDELADDQGDDADGGSFVMRNFAIAPGGFAELNLTMAQGSKVTAKFRGNAIVAWDVHSHPASGVRVHDSGEAPTGSVTFTAPTAGGYSLLWKNTGAAQAELVVSVELGPGVAVASWQPAQ